MRIETVDYEFTGPETNLGRFGIVKAGDKLSLTPHEASCITDDKRFRKWEGKPTVKPEPPPASKTPEEGKKAGQDEAERKARLSYENLKAKSQALDDLTKEELQEVLVMLRGEGKEIIVPKGASRSILLAALKAAIVNRSDV